MQTLFAEYAKPIKLVKETLKSKSKLNLFKK